MRRNDDLCDFYAAAERGGDFAVMFAQLAFVGHDAGHNQIFRSRRGNDTVGYLHGGLAGLSYDCAGKPRAVTSARPSDTPPRPQAPAR